MLVSSGRTDVPTLPEREKDVRKSAADVSCYFATDREIVC